MEVFFFKGGKVVPFLEKSKALNRQKSFEKTPKNDFFYNLLDTLDLLWEGLGGGGGKISQSTVKSDRREGKPIASSDILEKASASCFSVRWTGEQIMDGLEIDTRVLGWGWREGLALRRRSKS